MSISKAIDDDLQEKLDSYQVYSMSIEEMKNEKLNLHELLVKTENSDEKLIKRKSELNKQIIEKSQKLKILKNQIAQLIMKTINPYSHLAKLDMELADEIAIIIVKKKELNKKLKSSLIKEIATLYGLDQTTIIFEEKKLGIQDGFIINDKKTELKLFVKKSKIFQDETVSIDPRQLFVYKVLQHLALGPETRSIFTMGSSNPSGMKNCYIVTKDVGYSDNKNIKNVFFTDNYITEEDPHIDALVHWQKSFDSKQFRINFLILSMVNDLLHLNDSFATNAQNYGSLLKKSKTTAPQYQAILIDHEVNDSLFEYEPQKNPVISLIEKLKSNANRKKITGELISYKVIKDNRYFLNQEQIKFELQQAIKVVCQNLPKGIQLAEDEIKCLIQKQKESFSKKAYKKLEGYLEQTVQNIKTFFEMKSYYMSNIQEISKNVLQLLRDDLQFKGNVLFKHDKKKQ